MMSLNNRSCFALVVILVLVSGCTATKSPTQLQPTTPLTTIAVADAPSATLTATAEPSSTPLPTSTATSTPTLAATATETPTPFPSATPSLTPTATPVFIIPGFYDAGGCAEFIYTSSLTITFCVINVEVRWDHFMVVTVSWTNNWASPRGYIAKYSDVGNTDMYLTDNLGNHYDHVSVGGDAARYIKLAYGVTYIGTFTFPPAQPGATTFTFHDSDNGLEISDLALITPAIYLYQLPLKWYPSLTLEYRSDVWNSNQTEDGSGLLIHTEIPNCQLIEWQSSEIQGKYKNTLAIGPATYEIYGWAEPNWSVREYFATSGIETYDFTVKPLFHVTIPYDTVERCLNDVSTVLATLRLLQP